MTSFEVSDRVRYDGDLPEGWDRDGIIVAIDADDFGTQVCTVEFGDVMHVQDILGSDLARETIAAIEHDAQEG